MNKYLSSEKQSRMLKYLILIIIIFTFKFSTLFYLAKLSDCSTTHQFTWKTINIASYSGDADSYISPVENLLTKGSYSTNEGVLYAGRMPYYGMMYLPFRLVFPINYVLDFLVFFQILIESISVLVLGLIAINFVNNKRFLKLVLLLFTISLFTSYWSLYILPESLSISFLIFTYYFYFKYQQNENKSLLIFLSIFLALTIALKPYYVPFIFLFFIFHLFYHWTLNNNIKTSCKKAVPLVLYPLIITSLLLTPWIIRNYTAFNEFIPLQRNITASYNYTQSELALRRFIQAWGGSIVFWDKRSAACYFYLNPQNGCEFQIPDYAIPKGYTIHDINKNRDLFYELQRNYTPKLDTLLTNNFNDLTTVFKKENPFRYYILSPLLISKQLIIHSGSYYLPVSQTNPCFKPWQYYFKLVQSALYYSVLIFGFIGIILLIKKSINGLLLLLVPIYLLILFGFIIRSPEFRYFLHAYPFLIIGLAYLIVLVFKNFKLSFFKPGS